MYCWVDSTPIELGQQGADEGKLISEATTFVAACYGSKVEGDKTTHRYQMWTSKMANTKITSAPKLKALPPTAFVQHVHRAHHQAILMAISRSVRPSDLGSCPVWMACRRRWHNIAPNHTSSRCICCTAHHSAPDQVRMLHQPSMFYWEMWVRGSSNVMFNVLLL